VLVRWLCGRTRLLY